MSAAIGTGRGGRRHGSHMSTETLLRTPHEGEPGEGPSGAPSGRLISWLRANRLDLSIVLGLMAVLGIFHAAGMTSFPARFDDEGAYMSQAWAVLTRFDLSHYTYWYDHPPLGWLILATYSALTGSLSRAPYGVAAGREAMLLFHVASLALLYVLARRLGMRRPFAVLAVALFGLSPLGIFFHRMVLLDNIAMPFLIGGFVLLLSPGRKLGAHVVGAMCLALAVLIREILALFLPVAALLYWRHSERQNRRYSVVVTATTFFGLTLLYPAFALLRGELLPGPDRVSLVGALTWQLFERQGSGSVFDASSPAGEVLRSWLTLDPWILVLGSLAAGLLFVIGRMRWVAGMVLFLGLMLLRPGYLPVMYVIPALPLLALSIGGVFDEAWRRASQWSHRRSFSLAGAWIGRSLVGLAVAALIVSAGPFYAIGVARTQSVDADRPFAQARAWLSRHLERDDIVFVDGALWLDLVRDGHPVENVVWFYKLDSDPGVELPGEGNWKSIDYLVSSEVVRNSLYDLPQVEKALSNSEPVVVFGEGDGRVEIRRIRAQASRGSPRPKPNQSNGEG